MSYLRKEKKSKKTVTKTPQNQRMTAEQVENRGGGYGWDVGKLAQFERFLILGTEGDTYYAKESEMTQENIANMKAILDSEMGVTAVDKLIKVAKENRAARQTPLLLALAIACSTKSWPDVSKYALDNALPVVIKTPTQLFDFLGFALTYRGWGRGLRTAVQKWYNDKNVRDLCYQVTKYRNRNGWTHKDVIRLAHIKPKREMYKDENTGRIDLFAWLMKDAVPEAFGENLKPLEGFLKVQKATKVEEVVALIKSHRLVRETLPTQFLTEAKVWEAMLPDMPMFALLRNLGNMSKIGLLTTFSEAEKLVCMKLRDKELMQKARIHPIAVLAALNTYAKGKGEKGHGEWNPTQAVVAALEVALTNAFDTAEPMGVRTLVGVDISPSMSSGAVVGLESINPREGATVLSLVIAKREPQAHIMAFRSSFVDLGINANSSYLDAKLKANVDQPFGSTDCSLPMLYALERKIPVDLFVIITDNETNTGRMHPMEALKEYRQKMKINAKLAVIAMTATRVSICDSKVGGCLDMVGFDGNSAGVLAQLAKGEI